MVVIPAKAGIQADTGCPRIGTGQAYQVRHDGEGVFNCRVNNEKMANRSAVFFGILNLVNWDLFGIYLGFGFCYLDFRSDQKSDFANSTRVE
jgi:hypothetical protein